LRHVRRIADLPDLAAYDELVDFVEQIRYGAEALRYRARTELERIRAEVEAFGASLAHDIPLSSPWTGRHFAERIREFATSWPEDIREELAGDIAEVRHSAAPVVRQALVAGALTLINECLKDPIANTVAAERFLRDLSSAEEALGEAGALQQHAVALRSARERAARYRWQRKIDEAEVAEAGGNSKKAAKLRAEARVVLRQDWFRAFPTESAPET
jgi:hypothetical protein